MSYWVYLEDDKGSPVAVEPFSEGGTLAIGGMTEAELNVTYNYMEVFQLFDWSIRHLHQKCAVDTIEVLNKLADILPCKPYKADYWAPTPGNAGAVVHRLLSWARSHPDAVWRVS